jgi:3-phenylpropionate/trans-cinnamate dioxygenase ferredoxin reductase subunit
MLGCDVTVVDVLPAPLARVLDEAVGGAVARLHRTNGVELRLGVGVERVEGEPAVTGLVLGDGTRVAADVVVIGIGVSPATHWLSDSGLALDDGVVCDASLLAAPGVWAVGDLARWPHPARAGTLRLEHWTNAAEQPQAVAQSIVSGEREPFAPVPYFWSDQYDAKLQSLGTDTKGEETRLVWGSYDEPRWLALVRSGDRLSGVVGMRAAGRLMKLRPLLAAGTSWQDAVDATTA